MLSLSDPADNYDAPLNSHHRNAEKMKKKTNIKHPQSDLDQTRVPKCNIRYLSSKGRKEGIGFYVAFTA